MQPVASQFQLGRTGRDGDLMEIAKLAERIESQPEIQCLIPPVFIL
jgi:hypothetical protein